jgi:hypothetical protein
MLVLFAGLLPGLRNLAEVNVQVRQVVNKMILEENSPQRYFEP